MKASTGVFIVSMAAVASMLAACAALDAGDFVRVKTPLGVQQERGLPKSMTLNEAEVQYQAWYEDTVREGQQWKASIERGDELAGMLGNLTLQALNEAGPAIGGVPILGPAFPAIVGLASFALGKRGQNREKEASFNAGQKKATELIRGGSSA